MPTDAEILDVVNRDCTDAAKRNADHGITVSPDDLSGAVAIRAATLLKRHSPEKGDFAPWAWPYLLQAANREARRFARWQCETQQTLEYGGKLESEVKRKW